METILFVDDEEAFLTLGRIILSSQGYRIVAVQSGAEALESFRQEPKRFDLVITDVNMPGMNGYELAKQIFEIRSTIPVILCTGDPENIRYDMAGKFGIRDVLIKPLCNKELVEAVRRNLEAKDVEYNI